MENRCVACGEIIPEGLQVCNNCMANEGQRMGKSIKNEWVKAMQERRICPYCHSTKNIIDFRMGRYINHYWLECLECHWKSKPAISIRGAVRKWNIRYVINELYLMR